MEITNKYPVIISVVEAALALGKEIIKVTEDGKVTVPEIVGAIPEGAAFAKPFATQFNELKTELTILWDRQEVEELIEAYVALWKMEKEFPRVQGAFEALQGIAKAAGI